MASKSGNPFERAWRRLAEEACAAWPAPYARALRRYLAQPGKRLRPALYRVAAALELLHAFVLVHDDIIDRDDRRRGGPSLPALLDASAPAAGRGRGADLALVFGDELYALAIRAILEARVPPACLRAALRLLAAAALETGRGQHDELLLAAQPLARVRRAAILKVYDRKTAHYSAALPLAMGAVLAGAPPRTVSALAAWGLRVGRAYQIGNDLQAIMAAQRGDFREGKRTLALYYAWRQAPARARRELERLYGHRTRGSADCRRAAAILAESGGVDLARRDQARLLAAARRGLARLPVRPSARAGLAKILDGLGGERARRPGLRSTAGRRTGPG